MRDYELLDSDYELLDAGDGRRLERFGSRCVDRPAPAARGPQGWPIERWDEADLRYERGGDGRGRWVAGRDAGPWTIEAGGLVLELRPAAGGQVGLFAEHVATWAWLAGRAASPDGGGDPIEVLSLFAYTGGATLACAAAGAAVTHVDASRPAVAWARRNAALSGLGHRPVRWLVDDARAYVRREARRGRRYGGVILDPPTYGHARGAWRIDADLPGLLDGLSALCGSTGFGLLTAHTPGMDGRVLAGLLRQHLGVRADHGELALRAASGARLELGSFARWDATR